jgi:hypothetical protein
LDPPITLCILRLLFELLEDRVFRYILPKPPAPSVSDQFDVDDNPVGQEHVCDGPPPTAMIRRQRTLGRQFLPDLGDIKITGV